MKSTRQFMFILCLILALVFIIYFSLKLHQPEGGQKSHNDAEETAVVVTKGDEVKIITEVKTDISVGRKGGSVLDKLNTKPPQACNEKVCRPGYAAASISKLYPGFKKTMPMFLDWNYKRLEKVKNFLPPFGLKKQEDVIDKILTATKHYGLKDNLDSLSCKRCIIVGNGAVLFNKSLGSCINKYDIVVRLNEAPISGYVKDVGNKTTMRITYPEAAMQETEEYEKDSLFVLSAFKPLDFNWLRQMVSPYKLKSTVGFWKSVAHSISRNSSDIRILNPYFIREAAFHFMRLSSTHDSVDKMKTPTLGAIAITMALHNCDEVAVAGFGYDMRPGTKALMHYFGKVEMSAIKKSWTHDIPKEQEFLRKLVKANVITDLTNGILYTPQ